MSRTSVSGKARPYLIYSLREDDLAAWTIQDGQIAPVELTLDG